MRPRAWSTQIEYGTPTVPALRITITYTPEEALAMERSTMLTFPGVF